MKVFLLSALILTIIGSFGANGFDETSTSNSEPPRKSFRSKFQQSYSLKSFFGNKKESASLKKRVSFNSKAQFFEPPTTNEKTIFSLNLRKLKKKVSRKSRQYDPESTEFQFLHCLFFVVEKNYEMFNSMFRHVNGLRSSDSFLCQSDGEPPFPKEEIIDKLQEKKDFFENSLVNLLISLHSAYEYLRQLVAAIDSIDDNNLQIKMKHLVTMNRLAITVNLVNQHFNNVFKNFPMKAYRRHVRDIRRIIVESEEVNGIKMATEKLDNEMKELEKIYPVITEAFKSSLNIDFNTLEEATKEFSELVKEAMGLESKNVSSIENTIRALQIEEAALKKTKTSEHNNESRSPLTVEDGTAAKKTQMLSSIDQAVLSLKAHEEMLLSQSSSGSSSGDSSFSGFSSSSTSSDNGQEGKQEEKKGRKIVSFTSKLLKRLIK